VRYPREGHGLSETQHQIDSIDRSLAGTKNISLNPVPKALPTSSRSFFRELELACADRF